MSKRLLLRIILIIVLCIACCSCTKKEKKAEPVKLEKYEFINEWNSDLFEKYGLEKLEAPYESYHKTMEKGDTYVIGEFYTDEINVFKYFFVRVYKQLWDEKKSVDELLDSKNGVYSYESEYKVPITSKQKLEIKMGNLEEETNDKYAKVYIEYNKEKNRCTIKVQSINK